MVESKTPAWGGWVQVCTTLMFPEEKMQISYFLVPFQWEISLKSTESLKK